jgi:hypothetical protein
VCGEFSSRYPAACGGILHLIIKTKKVRPALVSMAVCLVLVFGWIGKVHQMSGRWVMINDSNSSNFLYGNNQYTLLYKTWLFSLYSETSNFPVEYRKLHSVIENAPTQIQNKLYMQMALDHIISRPDLFVIRTMSRIRTYFAFDTFFGAFLIKSYSVNEEPRRKQRGILKTTLHTLYAASGGVFTLRE